MNLDELIDKAYKCAVAHGWHEEEKSNKHWLCLVISELMEAVDADRKGRYTSEAKNLFEDGLESGGDFKELFELHIKDTVEDELADACIRLFDLADHWNISGLGMEFPLKNRVEYIEERSKITFTEWCFDVTKTIVQFDETPFHIGYLIAGILQEICCRAEIIGFDLLWHIEQKMKYNELREYKHGGRKY